MTEEKKEGSVQTPVYTFWTRKEEEKFPPAKDLDFYSYNVRKALILCFRVAQSYPSLSLSHEAYGVHGFYSFHAKLEIDKVPFVMSIQGEEDAVGPALVETALLRTVPDAVKCETVASLGYSTHIRRHLSEEALFLHLHHLFSKLEFGLKNEMDLAAYHKMDWTDPSEEAESY